MKREDIHIRDPYILMDNGIAYLYGSTDANIWGGECRTFEAYRSSDLEEFEGPFTVFARPDGFWANEQYWAPEVHRYDGAYYLFATFHSAEQGRRCQILRADRPLGSFAVFCPPFTPAGWDCLDATLWVEEGIPYAVFCHEWVQIQDGTIEIMRLKSDLSGADGKPVTLFRASDAPWVRKTSYDGKFEGTITDGPFVHKLKSGKLVMLWSSCVENNAYAVGMAVSDGGHIAGPWRHIEKPLFASDGGHACLFSFRGELKVALHAPNIVGKERPVFFSVAEEADRLALI